MVEVPDGEKMAGVPGVKWDGRSACNVGKRKRIGNMIGREWKRIGIVIGHEER